MNRNAFGAPSVRGYPRVWPLGIELESEAGHQRSDARKLCLGEAFLVKVEGLLQGGAGRAAEPIGGKMESIFLSRLRVAWRLGFALSHRG